MVEADEARFVGLWHGMSPYAWLGTKYRISADPSPIKRPAGVIRSIFERE
jgi:hypothetical protein